MLTSSCAAQYNVPGGWIGSLMRFIQVSGFLRGRNAIIYYVELLYATCRCIKFDNYSNVHDFKITIYIGMYATLKL